MKKSSIILILLLASVFPVTFVGSTIVYARDVRATPLNFQDFPEAFDIGMMAWDLDIIDIELVDPDTNGEGVYVAVLDTGLRAHWREYFPEERIKTEWGRGFVDTGVMKEEKTGVFVSNVKESKNFIGEHPHGTHVTSTIIGYCRRGVYVQGVAPYATIIPVKVLETYHGLPDAPTFGTSEAVAAGIDYVTGLALSHLDSRFIISMSLGAAFEEITPIEKDAIDAAIVAGVVVVASAGNEGPAGMGSPGSYAPVIAVGSSGWTSEWVVDDEYDRSWWYQDVPEDDITQTYISYFSSRANPVGLGFPQELDIVAPGSWIVGPYPDKTTLPWWANGNGYGTGWDIYYLGGTSMACPHVSGVAALMLQADDTLTPAEVQDILRDTADIIPDPGSAGYSFLN